MLLFRAWYWSHIFCSFGKKSRILGQIKVIKPENVVLGFDSTLNTGCFLNAKNLITIGNYVHISPYVILNTGGLNYREEKEDRSHLSKPIVIGDGAWVGSGAIINPGVCIGKNSIVGAGAVVTKNIPDSVVAVGVPARPIKKISD